MSRNRPLLDTPDPAARLAELMETRHSLYRELARMTIHTDGRRVADVAREIRDRLSASAPGVS